MLEVEQPCGTTEHPFPGKTVAPAFAVVSRQRAAERGPTFAAASTALKVKHRF